MRRLVEPELPLELLDQRRIEPLCAAVLAGDSVTPAASRYALVEQLGRSGAADPCGQIDRRPLQGRDDLLDRPPGAAWITMKLITMIPNSVGMISASRRMM